MGKLIVIGSGIKSLAHLSKETLVVMESSERLLYLVNDKVSSDYILNSHLNSESLEILYFKYQNRQDSYNAITEKIICEYKQYSSLCVLLYGHPTFFADFALDAVTRIRKQGGQAIILPAISSLDSLLADLLINPGKDGMAIYDATELLVHEHYINVYSYLILYQVSNLGMKNHKISTYLGVLKEYLLGFYPEDHEVIIYSAPQIPGLSFKLEVLELKCFEKASITHLSTVCLSPLKPKKVNYDILNYLGLIG
ncbi:TPA: SAM-dependent methyltransferase [Legionella bozemanae]|uniref:SAM-dependent methyltransferase n=1 Tax=Legionella bozemanae TaxID=447 RepID=UPI0010417CE7|nr:SAM-dependent methyltransferase [Legionella bozemanae]